MNLTLKIDGRVCDLDTHSLVIPGWAVYRMADAEAAREGRSLVINLPLTPRNEAIAERPHDPDAPQRFNATLHNASVEVHGEMLFGGTVRLLSTSDDAYRFEIRDGGAAWAKKAATSSFSSLSVECGMPLTPTAIAASWTDDTPLRFFPIYRDDYPIENSGSDLLPLLRVPSVDDYHPFLQVAALVEAIFGEAGYRVESDFFASDFFRSLYMSGAYPARNTLSAAERMGFRAARIADVQATADPVGRVYADPAMAQSTFGNIVDTATPQTLDENGEVITDLYNHGTCFRVADNGRIAFVPLGNVDVAFEYHIRYVTDHRIRSRSRLTGFDTLYLGTAAEFAFELVNRYEDHREGELSRGFGYRVVVFDHEEGNRYRLLCDRGNERNVVWGDFAARTALLSTPTDQRLSNLRLEVATIDNEWIPYPEDWALYDGYIEEYGRTIVELRLSTPAEAVAAHHTKYFHNIYFGGAEPGMKITLRKETSLTPLFRSGVGYGSYVRFADVAAHRIRQMDLLLSLAQLFNLRFATDERRKTVRIEPADRFFGVKTLDWRDRTDFLQPILHTEIAPEIHELRTWSYQEGDGVVRRFESATGEHFGSWTTESETTAAKEGYGISCNPIFAPTMNDTGNYAQARSASVMRIGDRDDWTADDSITPRIVLYAGMHSLPPREWWSYPATGGRYPLAAFHFEGDGEVRGCSLCFEDRNGIEGLNRFYRRQCAREATSERITLTVRITPDEYAALFTSAASDAFRASYLLRLEQGEVRAILHEVGAYDPSTQRLTCTFEREIDK